MSKSKKTNIVLDYIMNNKVELSKDYDRDEDSEPEYDLMLTF